MQLTTRERWVYTLHRNLVWTIVKYSFRWITRCCCCGTRTSSLLILLVYIVLHIILLSFSCLVLNSQEEMLDSLVSVLDTRDQLLQKNTVYQELRGTIVMVSVLRVNRYYCDGKCTKS